MSELQTLFLVFVAIYLIQCVAWIPQDAPAFRSALWSGWRSAGEGFRVGAMRTRGVLGNPLPPLEGVAVCAAQLAAYSPEGVARLGSARDDASFAPFAGMGPADAAGKQVRFGGATFLKADSPAEAARAAAWVEKLRAVDARQRGAAIEKQLATMLDFRAAAERLAAFEKATRLVGWTATALFFYLFLVMPLAVDAEGLSHAWPWLLGALLVLVAVVAWSFRRAHRQLSPEDSEARWTALLTIALSPVAAIRARDVLMRDLFREWHPLAVAHVLCAPKIFREAAARMLRECAFPIPERETGKEEAECARWFRERLLAAMRRMLAQAGMKPEELLAAPMRASAECAAYCPRCCQQYAAGAETCPDCGGIGLERY
jgi:hypothetical protein